MGIYGIHRIGPRNKAMTSPMFLGLYVIRHLYPTDYPPTLGENLVLIGPGDPSSQLITVPTIWSLGVILGLLASRLWP